MMNASRESREEETSPRREPSEHSSPRREPSGHSSPRREPSGHFEVEMKFPVSAHDAIEQQLLALGGTREATVTQVDRYFAHPARDFAKTDEAFRLRIIDQQNYLTYKGPKLDQVAKTRKEIEIPLGSGGVIAQHTTALLGALGFSTVAEVHKSRRIIELSWRNWSIEAVLDEVADVGSFLELEVLVSAEQLAAAQQVLLELSQHLGLTQSERRSYLELLLELRATRDGASLDT